MYNIYIFEYYLGILYGFDLRFTEDLVVGEFLQLVSEFLVLAKNRIFRGFLVCFFNTQWSLLFMLPASISALHCTAFTARFFYHLHRCPASFTLLHFLPLREEFRTDYQTPKSDTPIESEWFCVWLLERFRWSGGQAPPGIDLQIGSFLSSGRAP
jgi:hypothetical protein